MTRPIETFDLDRDLDEWSEEELDELAEALMETESRLGQYLADVRGGQS